MDIADQTSVDLGNNTKTSTFSRVRYSVSTVKAPPGPLDPCLGGFLFRQTNVCGLEAHGYRTSLSSQTLYVIRQTFQTSYRSEVSRGWSTRSGKLSEMLTVAKMDVNGVLKKVEILRPMRPPTSGPKLGTPAKQLSNQTLKSEYCWLQDASFVA